MNDFLGLESIGLLDFERILTVGCHYVWISVYPMEELGKGLVDAGRRLVECVRCLTLQRTRVHVSTTMRMLDF